MSILQDMSTEDEYTSFNVNLFYKLSEWRKKTLFPICIIYASDYIHMQF